MRDALETAHDLATATGVADVNPSRDVGLDVRSHEIVEISDGTWKLAP